MTLIGWFFWGFILFLILLSFVLGKYVGGPGEKDSSQIRAEQDAQNYSNMNSHDSNGGF